MWKELLRCPSALSFTGTAWLALCARTCNKHILSAQACACGHTAAAKVLLRRGADAAARDASGDTAAHVAARGGHVDTAALVLEKVRLPGP